MALKSSVVIKGGTVLSTENTSIIGSGSFSAKEQNSLSGFGENVFNEDVMRALLPKQIYKSLMETMAEGKTIDPSISDVVANAMKDWAMSKGATHYTHWFQPLTGSTAEKHDSFINPSGIGKAVFEFSGKELVKGEPDASSFPSGGTRSTFEARGYTAWDCTSPAFIRDDEAGKTLCIPTAFYSYTGEALDKKTPLLRSMEAVSTQALRVLRAFGDTISTRVIATVGPEQEYFLIDQKFYEQRLDLIATGRTLFGAPAPKGQELDDHYFGSIKERVSAYMHEVDEELWKLGVPAKTKHNEVAPGQYELAVVFNTTNVAVDQNQLVMDALKKIALRHELVCLLHEKPFAGVNGSGKHNNWSIATNEGQNLLEPGKTPHDNLQFLMFITSVVAAIDKFAPLLRSSAANPGNDHRLGANEAPPAIISIFLGEQLEEILGGIEKGTFKAAKVKDELNMNVKILPATPMDATDRNRTSPFAFTGNKFEFRMPPSSGSISGPNVVLNTIVADTLSDIANELEKAPTDKIDNVVQDILVRLIKKHKRVIFNGNNYADEWVVEAKKRGLANIKNAVDAYKELVTDDVVEVFKKFGVLSKTELEARHEIYTEQYVLHLNIEAQTMVHISDRQLIPAVSEFLQTQIGTLFSVKEAGLSNRALEALVKEVNSGLENLMNETNKLNKAIGSAQNIDDIVEQAEAYRDIVFSQMNVVREIADALEQRVGQEFWPLPSYAEMLFLA